MLFGSSPGLGVNADTAMAHEVASIFLHEYERDFFTIPVPDCFDDFFS